MAHHATKQPTCANCHFAFRTDVPDEFCPRCGQQNHDVDLSFGHVAEELLEGIFHFDSKVFRTARLLLLRPGELTRRFLAGQRVPYVPPVRLYVFVSFIFFLVLGWTAGHPSEHNAVAFRRGFFVGLTKNESVIRTKVPGQEAVQLDVPLEHDSTITERDLAHLPDRPSNAQVDSLLQRKGTSPTLGRRLLIKRFLRWRHTDPAEVVHDSLRIASVAAFVLMPLAALLLQLAYRRQQRYYLGHLVFTIHLHCVLFVLLMVDVGLGKIGLDTLNSWVLVLIIPYLLLALRRVYAQSWGKTIAKGLLLATTYSLLLTTAIVISTLILLVAF